MNKAFVKETDAADADEDDVAAPALPAGSKNYMTPAGYAQLDAEFNQTLSSLTMQGVDLSKIKGGRKGQQRVAQAVALGSANRVLTRRALDLLKSIAMGEYKPTEQAKSDMISEGGPVEPVESEEKAGETESSAGSEVSAASLPEKAEESANEAESSTSE